MKFFDLNVFLELIKRNSATDLVEYGDITRDTEFSQNHLKSFASSNIRHHLKSEADKASDPNVTEQVRESKETYNTYDHNNKDNDSLLSEEKSYKSIRQEEIIDAA